MQHRTKTPGGLATGCGPTYASSGAKVTCAGIFCGQEPTHVLIFTTREGQTERWDAHCAPCLERRIRPAAEVDAATERDMRLGNTGSRYAHSDKYWSKREFTEQEAGEIEQIKAGELVETYVSPGEFEWRAPAAPKHAEGT